MQIRLLAVGTRLPDWVNAATAEYGRRLNGLNRFELVEIPLGKRTATAVASRAVADEGARLLKAIEIHDFVIALDVKGKAFDTPQLAAWLKARLQDGRGLVFLIGGPDGLAPECLERADLRWSLSPLTLPHGLARVVVIEQLYRAFSLLKGHPYHRE